MTTPKPLTPRRAARGLRTTRTAGGNPKTTACRYSFIGPAEIGPMLDGIVAAVGAKSRGDLIRRLVYQAAERLGVEGRAG